MEKILQLLDAGQLILAPTDTIWGILCDATNPDAVNKVYDLKKRPRSQDGDFREEALVEILKTTPRDFLQMFNHIHIVINI